MNSLDSILDSLLKSAARAPKNELNMELPAGFEQRTLAAWRRSNRQDEWGFLQPLFRYALAGAFAVMMVSLFLNQRLSRVDPYEEINIPNRVLYANLLQ